jgi:hypothetical protein
MYRINRRLRVQALFYVIQTITPNERHFVESNHYCSVVRQNGMTYISYGYFLWPSYFRLYTTLFCFWKKGVKIPKGKSESVNRRTCVTFTKRNTTKWQSMIYKTLHIKQKIENSESHSKTFRCPVRVDKSCSTCGICRVTLITNPVICHERESDCVVVTTIGVNE